MERWQVKYQWKGETRYGIVDSLSEDAKEAKVRGNLLIEDAILPLSYEVPNHNNVVDIRDSYPNEYDKYVDAEREKAEQASKALPKGVQVGKLFTMPVGDGCAYYVVTKVNRKTCKVEWRGYELDRYRDLFFMWGGSFRLSDVARMLFE